MKTLPPTRILQELYTEKLVSVPARKLEEIIKLASKKKSVMHLSDKQEDYIQLGMFLQKFSNEGAMCAYEIFNQAKKSGNDDAHFLFLRLRSKGIPGYLQKDVNASSGYIELAKRKQKWANHFMALQSIKYKAYQKALEYLAIGAESGSGESQLMLGEWYQSGMHVAKNEMKAFDYILKAHENNIIKATAILSQFYYNGYGPLKGIPDYKKAFEYAAKAAAGGIPIAQHNLAEIYLHHTKDLLELDLPEIKLGKHVDFAIEYYKMAAHQKFTISQYTLGNLYHRGITDQVPVDLNYAYEYYKKAMDDYSPEKAHFKDYYLKAKEEIVALEKSGFQYTPVVEISQTNCLIL